MSDDEVPRTPGDDRPNDEPYFIDNECMECGADLEQADDALENGFKDEFVCSDDDCDYNALHMDWPESEWDRIDGRSAELDPHTNE